MSKKGSVHSGFSGVFKSFTKSLKPTSGNVHVVFNALVVGGGKDMPKLLLQLQSGSLTSRASAASEITENIEKYSISSIPEVWYLARDLCDHKAQSSIRRVAVKLMIQCIKHAEVAVSNKLMFFNDISTYCQLRESSVDAEFDLFLNALRNLTDDGKDIHDLYIYDSSKNWRTFIILSFSSLSKAQLNSSDDSALRNLLTLVRYLKNCFKFNSNVIDEEMVSSIIRISLRVSESVQNTDLLSALLDLIKIILMFGFIPQDMYYNVLISLCRLSASAENLNELAWESIKSMYYNSPTAVFNTMCQILQNPEFQQFESWDTLSSNIHDPSPKSSVALQKSLLGALDMLERILLEAGTRSFATDYTSDLTITSLIDCMNQKVGVINTGILRMLDHLLADHEVCDALFPFQSWYSSSRSMFLLLSSFRVQLEQESEYWTSLCSSIFQHFDSGSLLAPKSKIIDLFMRYPDLLPKNIAEYCLHYFEEEKHCTVLDPFSKENCRKVLDSFYYSHGKPRIPSELRIKALSTIVHGYEFSLAMADDFAINKDIILDVLRSSLDEDDPAVLSFVVESFLSVFLKNSSLALLQSLIALFIPLLQSKRRPDRIKSIVSLGSYGSSSVHPRVSSIKSVSEKQEETVYVSPGYITLLARTFCKHFVIFCVEDALKAKETYEFLLHMLRFCLNSEMYEPVIVLLKCFMRLRATSDRVLYFTEPANMGGLATALKKNKEDESYTNEENNWWVYPEGCDFLPREYFGRYNQNLQAAQPGSTSLHIGQHDVVHLDLSPYFSTVLTILEEFYHWEVYSFVWAHLCSQLANRSFFAGQRDYIMRLHKVVCDQLTLRVPKSLVFPLKNSEFTKHDLQVVCIRTMSSLIGYHTDFRKSEEDQIVSSLLFSLDSWQQTAIPCFHLLNVCCYEIPLSLKKFLTAILTRLQNGVTSAFASSPALEFLMSLIHVPSMTSSFTLGDFKRVFAIAFKYIQYALDVKSRGANSLDGEQPSILQSHGVDAEVDKKASTQTTEITPILNEYLLVVSQLVVCLLFLKIKLYDRRHFSGFIIKNIIISSGCKNIGDLDERSIAFLDFISRFTFSDIPLEIVTNNKRTNSTSLVSNKWIVGHSIITIETESSSGNCTITLRRPTGISVFDMKLDKSMLPATLRQEEKKPIVTNGYFLLQMFKPLDPSNTSKPIALLEDAATERAINTLDRLAVVSQHKVGIMYIGPGQKSEEEILGNAVGSAAFNMFLDGIGHLVRLKDCRSVYIGGLDSENGTDGDYAYFWSDHVAQLVFHTTTLMPTLASDKYFSSKKRHIGNNHVNIFFDESGVPFNFNVIKSQFTFMNIVISPHTVAQNGDSECDFYIVKTYRRSGVPGIFSTTHFKLISREQLPHFVRNTVLLADRLAQVWHYSVRGDYTTNWALRVRHIDVLTQKALDSHRALKDEQLRSGDQSGATENGTATGENAYVDMTQSFLEQLQPTSVASVSSSQIASKFEYVSDNDNEAYSLLEFNSYV